MSAIPSSPENASSAGPESNSTQQSYDFHLVGVGASAGGLEALENFFKVMPTDLGVAFVVVQHLSPDFKSHMQQLLARQTAMPIFRVENGMEVKPNSIYLIPPNKEMIISERRLLLTDRDPKKTLSHPIDQFFRSIANDLGRYAIGVVLSGTGSDGSRGVRDIHEAGGLVLCQDEDSAGFDGMPLNAQETGAVDLVLNPEAMSLALTRFVTESLSPDLLAEQEIVPTQLAGIEKLFDLLRVRYGIDFASYRESTVARRVKRRMSIRQVHAFEQYIDELESDTEELDSLYKDLLIGVTQFFRDQEAFERLEHEIIPDLLERVPVEEQIRLWVAGCATGEEAYSIAFLLHEALTKARRPIDVKIFATDVHPTSLEVASRGVYPDSALEEIDESRRNRYFVTQAEGCQVIPEIRRMIVFAPHNLVQDAPFTQLDFVSCRNLLIYFQPVAQKKALSFFHFALKAGGMLMLGPSESTNDLSDEFSVLDKRWKIYRKRRHVRLPADIRVDFSTGPTRLPRAALGSNRTRARNLDQQLLSTYDQLLNLKMPASFLVDESGELIHTFGGAERLLSPRGGRTTTNLIELVDPDLKTSVSAAIQHALRESDEVSYSGLTRRNASEQPETLRLAVQPLIDPKSSVTNLLVEFSEPLSLDNIANVTASHQDNSRDIVVDVGQLTLDRVKSLEDELRTTQENLQAAVEELETANEELQATNEELVASNEELQSTNEELHSVNEELYTVNAEHQRKIEELTDVTNDLDNLLSSTDIGVVFLDEEFCVRRFTPQIADTFSLMPQDIGRRIDSFSSKLMHPALMSDLQTVRDSRSPVEREVKNTAGHHYLLRILPYRSPSTPSRGLLLTLIDIENIRQAENDSLESERRFRILLDSTAEGVIGLDREGICTFVNQSSVKLLGCDTESDLLGTTICPYVHQPNEQGEFDCDICDSFATGEAIHSDQSVFARKDGSQFPVEYWSYPVHADGELAGAVVTFYDIRERRDAEQQLRETRLAAESANHAKSRFLANMSHELRTPLSAILGFADILLVELQQEQHRQRVTTIKTNGSYLLELLNDILDLSKIEAGKLSIHPEQVDLPALLTDVVTLMRVRSDAKDLPLKFSFLSEIPRRVETDPRRLRQVLVNLVGNAIKFTSLGEVSLTAHVGSGTDGTPRLVMEVRDTGIGIDADDLSLIFKPFAQADKQQPLAAGGTGLGLSISQLLAHEMGGEIEVESIRGMGSSFRFTIPLADSSSATVPPQEDVLCTNLPEKKQPEPLQDRLHGRRILVADDRRDIRHVAEFFLKQGGAEVLLAENGELAVQLVKAELAQGNQLDLVLMDMQMPKKDGYQATRELIGLGHRLPIIALTAAAMKGERERCLQAGCRDYLTKPIDGETLVAVCAKNLAFDQGNGES